MKATEHTEKIEDIATAETPATPAGFTLPVFPWDTIAYARRVAASHPDGLIDLSVGTPVDPVHPGARAALTAAAEYPGYPPGVGSAALLEAIVSWFAVARGVPNLSADMVIPTVGSKELVASLPLQLGLHSADAVGYPEISYPTYEVGAHFAHATPLRLSKDVRSWPTGKRAPKLVWLNTPGNPDGSVLSIEQLRTIVAWGRENGAVIASDECYALLYYDAKYAQGGTPSLLDPQVTGGDLKGLLVVHSLSKEANMAGYRAAFIAGDRQLIARLREIRKHWGLMVPGPVQAAMIAALGDGTVAAEQRRRYGGRRAALLSACEKVGLSNHEEAVAGLYLWLKAEINEKISGRQLLNALAKLGILVAPGDFYGPAGADRIRMGLTGSDADVAAAVERLNTARNLDYTD